MSVLTLNRINRRLHEVVRPLHVYYALNLGRKPVIKVYGLLRTGTNYITQLIDLNYEAFSLSSIEGGWKHGPCEYDPDIKYVFMVKDPYSWVVSLFEWEKIHCRTSNTQLSEFLH